MNCLCTAVGLQVLGPDSSVKQLEEDKAYTVEELLQIDYSYTDTNPEILGRVANLMRRVGYAIGTTSR